MRNQESRLQELTGTNRPEKSEWEDLSRGEKVFAGLLYTNLVVAPVVNAVLYAGVICTLVYIAASGK
ncbi:MAG: hypothetical protein KJ600_01165 [Nanoarchaeota archaeon]|nr:hypothetical protein [Nanoarchaeota archaeon]